MRTQNAGYHVHETDNEKITFSLVYEKLPVITVPGVFESFSAPAIKQLGVRVLWLGVALKQRVQPWLTHERGSRAFERGGGCVVGEFVLAYQW